MRVNRIIEEEQRVICNHHFDGEGFLYSETESVAEPTGRFRAVKIDADGNPVRFTRWHTRKTAPKYMIRMLGKLSEN